MDEEYSLHTEYMIQLSELGLIGFILFLSFYFFIFKNLHRLRKLKIKKENIEIHLALLIILLLIITTTRMFVIWYLYTIVGVVIGFVNNQNYKRDRMNSIVGNVSKITNDDIVIIKRSP